MRIPSIALSLFVIAAHASAAERGWVSAETALPRAAASFHLVLADEGDLAVRSELFRLAHRSSRLLQKTSELATGADNVSYLVEFFSGQKDGAKTLAGDLASFREYLAELAELQAPLAKDLKDAASRVTPEAKAQSAAKALQSAILEIRVKAAGVTLGAERMASEIRKYEAKLGFELVANAEDFKRRAQESEQAADKLAEQAEQILAKSASPKL
jgi:hypothetical protein